MNYTGHEKLCVEVATVANSMCDLQTMLNGVEHCYRSNPDVLAECLIRQTPFYVGTLFVVVYGEISELDARLKDQGEKHVRNL